jgi:hypothetical protein
LLGSALTWPLQASTLKSFPRNFDIVFAFAGDSTITSDFSINKTYFLDFIGIRVAYYQGFWFATSVPGVLLVS